MCACPSAKAGTHNHHSLLEQKPLATVPNLEAAAYGSLRSQGRRRDTLLGNSISTMYDHPALIPPLDNTAKHPPHFALGLLDPRLERGKDRGVAGPRQHAPQI